ncbi:MAG TPA: hypothetical protein VMT50_11095, partial [Steroidobacteraceae bacterium]|nr:hypothetical protein [Steroidobacteraceae bacterium]
MKRIGTVALVLVGLWALTEAILRLSFPLEELINGGDRVRRLIAVPLWLLPAVATAALGIWLIARRRELAARWFADDGPEVRPGGRALLRAGILIIALASLVGGVVALVSAGARFLLYAADKSGLGAGEALRMVGSQLAAGACGVVIALVLIATASRLSRRLWRETQPPEPIRPEPAHCPHCGA